MFAAIIAVTLTGTFGAQVVITNGADTRIRRAPDGNAQRICVLPGKIPLWAVDKQKEWYKIQLYPALSGWVWQDSVKPTGQREPLPPAVVGKPQTGLWEGGEQLIVPMTRMAAYRIVPSLDPSHLQVQVFDSSPNADAIGDEQGRYLLGDIKTASAGPGWTKVDVDVKTPTILGYLVHYEDDKNLVVNVKEGLPDGRLEGKIICLDPGHGGPDDGAIGPGGTKEKTVNLAIAIRAAELLGQLGAQVVLTRDSDRQVGPPGCTQAEELEARLQVAVRAGADLFVSIHNNCASRDCSIGGTESYYYTAFSQPLAADLLNAVSYSLGSQRRWVKPAVFHVLRSTDCPRALVECLYISNPAEEKRMAKPDFVERAAEGIVAGIRQYLQYAVGH